MISSGERFAEKCVSRSAVACLQSQATTAKAADYFRKRPARSLPRQGAETWEFLAIDIESPYLDTRPNLIAGQAEWRDYRARYWDGTPVGDWSAVLRVSVG